MFLWATLIRIGDWCIRCYRRRIVNVNVNIIVAGLLAMGVTVAAMKGLEHIDVPAKLAKLVRMPWELGPFTWTEKTVISILTLVIDLVADVLVYYVLHWLANHVPKKAAKLGHLIDDLNPAYAHLTFVQDATMVQVERLVLSPLFYIIAVGGQQMILHADHSAVATSVAVPFTTAILVTRCIHTVWMHYQQKRQLAKIKAGAIVLASSVPAPIGSTAPATTASDSASPVTNSEASKAELVSAAANGNEAGNTTK